MQKIFKSVLSICLAIAMYASTAVCFGASVYNVAEAATADSYYSGITAKSGTALLGQLHDLIVETHKTYTSYTDCKTPAKVMKTDPGDASNTVREFYTQEDMSSSWGSGKQGTWNREHVWCQSLSKDASTGTQLWGENGGGSDMHHIRPSESSLNGTRSNNKYGVVNGGKEAYQKSTSGGNVALGGYYVANSTFEPLDNVKGDVARIVMYVYTHYNNASNVGGTKESKYTHGNLPFTNVMSASSESAAKELLLEWNKLDPVDDIERTRNEAVYEIQGNRNPFIDNESYAEAIWGDGTVVDPGIDPTPSDELKSISLNETALTLNVGQTYDLTVTPNPSTASKSVTWTSSDSSVATVANGKITAKSAGTATITATSTSNSAIKATATVTVKQSSSTDITAGKVTITRDKFTNVSGGYGTYSWSADGIGGTAYIYGGESGSMQFNTSKTSQYLASETPTSGAIKKVTLKTSGNSSWTLYTSNQPYSGITSGNPSEGHTHYERESIDGSWTVSGNDTYFALVLGGTGVAYIDSIEVEYENSNTETPPELQSIAISPSEVTLEKDEYTAFTITSVPSSVTAEVNWASSNPSVAVVSQYGIVMAISAGTATITATSTSNASIKATATVTVKQSSTPTPTPSDTFEAGTYKLAINITAEDLNKKVYFTGAIQNSYFGATTTDVAQAVDVVVAEKDDGYTIKVGNQYLELQYYNDSNGATQAKLVLVNSSTREWLYNTELGVLTWKLTTNAHEYFLGAYTSSAGRTYDNVSANDVKYVSGDNASNIGVTRFIATFEKVGGTTPIEPDIPLEGITITPSEITLKEGKTFKLSVETIPSNLSADIDWTSIIEWTSSNPLVATVSSDGTVTAISAGTATITATSKTNEKITASATVTVEALPKPPILQSIAINPSSVTIKEGESTKLNVESVPSEVTAEVNWTSSNPSIATVSSDGTVMAISVGTVTITATSKTNSAIKANATVVVNPKPPVLQDIVVNPSSVTLKEGENTKLNVESVPSEVTADVNWTSSNPLVATVSSDGTVTAISAGTATITATSKTNSAINASVTVTVEKVVNDAKVKAFHDAVEAINGDGAIGSLNLWRTSINVAVDLYNDLSDVDKEAAKDDIAVLCSAIESYNETIKAYNEAADSADKTALKGAGKFH